MAIQEKTIIRKPYVYYGRLTYETGEVSRTKQSFKAEADINTIMKKYVRDGVIDHVRDNPGQFVDLPEVLDYQEALNVVIKAGEAFDELPGNIRRRFDHNAVEFLEFMNDPEKVEESIELGLREIIEPDEPVLEPPATPPEEPEAPPE